MSISRNLKFILAFYQTFQSDLDFSLYDIYPPKVINPVILVARQP